MDPRVDAKIVAVLQNYPAIWDRKCSAFKNKVMKENSFKKLAEQVNVSVKVVEERYKSIREKFRKEKLKEAAETKSGAGQASERWELYEPLQFLNEQILQRRRRVSTFCTDIPEAEDEFTVTAYTESASQLIVQEFSDDDSGSPVLGDVVYDEFVQNPLQPQPSQTTSRGNKHVPLLSPSFSEASTTVTEASSPTPQKKKQKDNLDVMISRLTHAATSISEAPNTGSCTSRFAWLGKYIAETLNGMDPVDAEETAHDITELLYQKKKNSL